MENVGMGIMVDENGEIIVQGKYLMERLEWARRLNSTMQWMTMNDMWILGRSNQKYGGILFHREMSYEEGVDRPKRIGFLLTPEGKVVPENLDKYNDATGRFESVIIAEFPPFVLTARTGNHPKADILYWLPPSDANREIDKEQQIQTLTNMVHAIDQEAKSYRLEMNNALNELNSMRIKLRDSELRNATLMNKINSLEPEIAALRHRLEAMRIERIKDEETIKAVLERAEKDGKFRGLSGIELVREITNEIVEAFQKMRVYNSGITDTELERRIKLLEEQLHHVRSEKEQKKKAESLVLGGAENAEPKS
ncbi:MAG: hypothetical protein DRN17_01215 [Thermoplasmata archaeon]|nr:MAG: hypothetical protein DRN17_01215 [Thermoplasmata archaeon]